MVEGARLEYECAGYPRTVGSNPTLSALWEGWCGTSLWCCFYLFVYTIPMPIFVYRILGFGMLVFVVFFAFSLSHSGDRLPVYNEVHEHVDVVVWVNGSQVDLSESYFQSTDEVLRHRFLHLHDGDGSVLHIHAKDQHLVDFFESIGMTVTDSCITLYTGEEYCADDAHVFLLSVRDDGDQWRVVRAIERFIPQDLQQVVLYFGLSDNDEDLALARSVVTSDACYHSGKCPERGTPSSIWYETCGKDSADGCDALIVEPLRRRAHSH